MVAMAQKDVEDFNIEEIPLALITMRKLLGWSQYDLDSYLGKAKKTTARNENTRDEDGNLKPYNNVAFRNVSDIYTRLKKECLNNGITLDRIKFEVSRMNLV